MKSFIAVLLLSVMTSTAHAGFEQGYLSPQDIIRALYNKFDKIMISKYEGSCQYMPSSGRGGNRNALGDINPASGEVAVSLPDSSFLSWYNPCLAEYLRYASGAYTLSEKDETAKIDGLTLKFYRPLVEKIKSTTCAECTIRERARSITFNVFSDEEKKLYIANLVEWALGSDEEIMSYGLITDMHGFRADLLTFANKFGSSSLSDVNVQLTSILLKRDEFLQY
jgi:hypothetical protein